MARYAITVENQDGSDRRVITSDSGAYASAQEALEAAERMYSAVLAIKAVPDPECPLCADGTHKRPAGW